MPTPRLLANPLSPLVARDLVKSYGDRTVLDGVDLVASPGQPLGVVGENGAGKSTLLRLLAGVEPVDSGTVTAPLDLGHLPQEPSFTRDATIGQVLDEVLAPLHEAVRHVERLAARLAVENCQDEYAATLAWAELHDAWDADRRAATAADRLGLGRLDRHRPVAAMSGGQRTRLALAALVTRRPTCVLLDEPTNHLDDDAVGFVEDFLRDLPGVVVTASHDRTFLENVCGTVLDLDPAHLGVDGEGGNRFTGGYSGYLAHKQAARRRWERAFLDQQDEINRLRRTAATTARQVAHNRAPRDNDKFIHHFKGAHVARTVSRRVRDAERRLELVERDLVPKPPAQLRFSTSWTAARPAGGIQVRDLDVAGRVVVPHLDVAAGEHLLVTGANGSGKSTLLKVLAGELAATSGSVQVSARRIGHLPQDVTFRDPSRTAEEVYAVAIGRAPGESARHPRVEPRHASVEARDASVEAVETPLRALGLLSPHDVHRPVGQLSIGQQRRLGLAVLVARQPDLLLLDEPTNHISLTLAEDLEEALQAAPATVVLASHDRWLRSRWSAQVLHLPNRGPHDATADRCPPQQARPAASAEQVGPKRQR